MTGIQGLSPHPTSPAARFLALMAALGALAPTLAVAQQVPATAPGLPPAPAARVSYLGINELAETAWQIGHQQAVGDRDSTTTLATASPSIERAFSRATSSSG